MTQPPPRLDLSRPDTAFATEIAGRPSSASGTGIRNQEQRRLAADLRAPLETHPLEDGTHHRAEKITGEALQARKGFPVLDWLGAFSLNVADPESGASVLPCLGRHPDPAAWRASLVRDGLASDNVEIKDAALQAAESWGGAGMRAGLEVPSESPPWLRDYIREVIDNL